MRGLIISCSWNAFKWINGVRSARAQAEGIVAELNGLGFDKIELSFNLDAALVDEIGRLVRKGAVKVASLHNICPIPDDIEPDEAGPDYYSLASLDEKERALAIRYAKRTIGRAAELGASAVVMHTGKVEMEGGTKALAGLYEKGLKGTREYTGLMDEMLRKRDELKPRYVAAALNSLRELLRAAEKEKITLGIETRIYLREIPSFDEIGLILDEFKGSRFIGYWHDTGHAQYAENLGFGKHRDYLDAYSDKMVGLHLHDIKGTRDHLAPAAGEIDFSMLKKYIRPGMLKVLEPHRPAEAGQIIQGADHLEAVLS